VSIAAEVSVGSDPLWLAKAKLLSELVSDAGKTLLPLGLAAFFLSVPAFPVNSVIDFPELRFFIKMIRTITIIITGTPTPTPIPTPSASAFEDLTFEGARHDSSTVTAPMLVKLEPLVPVPQKASSC